MPFLHNQGLTTSDEESQSVASFRIRDSRLDVILRQKAHNDSNESIENAAAKVDIEEYESTDDDKSGKNDYVDISDPALLKCVEEAKLGMLFKKDKDGRGSKNSSKSNRSRKSSRQSLRKTRRSSRVTKNHRNTELKTYEKRHEEQTCEGIIEKYNRNNTKLSDVESSFTSYCSELSPFAIQSSYSGVSAGKTHSRNSKTSCDVGIQANAHEIATQTMSSYEMEKGVMIQKTKESQNSRSADRHKEPPPKPKRTFEFDSQTDLESYIKPGKKHSESYGCHDDLETQQLLLPSPKTTIVPKKRKDSLSINCQSEAERLKLLLLPSK